MGQEPQELDPALYHVTSDPHEVTNLAFDKDHQQIAMMLKDKLLNIVLGDDRLLIRRQCSPGFCSNGCPTADVHG